MSDDDETDPARRIRYWHSRVSYQVFDKFDPLTATTSQLERHVHAILASQFPSLSANHPISKNFNCDYYFEVPQFSGKICWGVEVKARLTKELISTIWGQAEPAIRAGSIDRMLLISLLPLEDSAQNIIRELRQIEHLTVEQLEAWAAKSVENDDAIPGSDRFVHISDNQPDVDEAKETLAEIENDVASSNELPVTAEERAALLADIRFLITMLEHKVVRLGMVQYALGHNSVLRFMKGEYGGYLKGALLAKALELLFKIFPS